MSEDYLDKKEGYEWSIPQAPPDAKWATHFQPVLIDDANQLAIALDNIPDGSIIAFDFETIGLDPSVPDPVVGFSFSVGSYNGSYVPLRHMVGKNAPIECLGMIYKKLCVCNVLMYNAAFDLTMWRAEGFDWTKIPVVDVLAFVFLADTNYPKNGLKSVAKRLLGRDRPDFAATVGGSTFADLLPDEGLSYAAADAADTYAVYAVLAKTVMKECPVAAKIDLKIAKTIVHIINQEVKVDTTVMREVLESIDREIEEIKNRSWTAVGYPFNLQSRPDIAKALATLGVDTGVKTRTGNVATSKDVLAEVDHPFCRDIVRFSQLVKAKGTYVEKLAHHDVVRFNFRIFRAATGRFSSGGSKGDYWLDFNSQNMTKPKPMQYRAFPDPDGILGWSFRPADECDEGEGSPIEGYSPVENVRRALVRPGRDWLFVSIDFVMEELMIAAMLSREPVLMEALRKGEDCHKAVAVSMFGAENYNKEMRKRGKIANFGLLYGGSPQMLHRTSGLPIDECVDIFTRYWKTMHVLKSWQRRVVADSYHAGGNAYTAYGRPRRCKFYLTHPEQKMKAYGERTVVSHIVQGTSGDVMRICLNRFFEHIYPEYGQDYLRFVNAVHDEIDFVVHESVAEEVIDKVRAMMGIKVPNCELPLRTSVEIGTSYGYLFPYERDKNGYAPVGV